MGFIVAIVNAFVASAQDVFVKKLKGENTFFVIWLRMASALPVLAVVVTVFAEWKIPAWPFWALIFGVSLPLEIIQFYFGISATQQSPLSLIAPLSSFTSIFLIPVGYVILGEFPTRLALAGILSVVIGTFFLGWQPGLTKSLAEPVRNVFREKGSYYVLISAFLVSISISVLKKSFQYGSPFLTAFWIAAAIVLALTPVAFIRPAVLPAHARGRFFSLLGLSSGLSLALHYTGLSLLPAAYFISVKRISILLNVIFGRVVFDEENIRERLIGALLMVAGVVLIAIG